MRLAAARSPSSSCCRSWHQTPLGPLLWPDMLLLKGCSPRKATKKILINYRAFKVPYGCFQLLALESFVVGWWALAATAGLRSSQTHPSNRLIKGSAKEDKVGEASTINQQSGKMNWTSPTHSLLSNCFLMQRIVNCGTDLLSGLLCS
jgi:hypothetical protein